MHGADRTGSLSGELARLQVLRTQHGIRASCLPADLALIGLLDDLVDAIGASLELLQTTRPHRAFSMVRAAFEAAQRILLIATDDDYPRLGTRAWLYFHKKDARLSLLAGAAQTKIGTEESRSGDPLEDVLRVWEKYFPDARSMAVDEGERLAKVRNRTQFVEGDVTLLLDLCYAKIARHAGRPEPRSIASVNRDMYAFLSRETHACLRIQPSALRIDAAGFVEVSTNERDLDLVTRNAIGALETIASEAIAALEFRVETRQEHNVANLKTALEGGTISPKKGHLPDLGISLLEEGIGHATITLPGVQLYRFDTLPDGTITASATSGCGTDARFASFDFSGECRSALLDLLTRHAPMRAAGFGVGEPRRHLDLPAPIVLTLQVTLGAVTHGSSQTFIPLVVHALWETALAAGRPS